MTMSTSTRANRPRGGKARRSGNTGPISFFISLFIVALGAIQLVSTFHTYAMDLADLNSLKREEASLQERKQDLENEIARWDDDAYVTAQARERLGFVFPGEQAVRVMHPEAVTGDDGADDAADQSSDPSGSTLPWYEELDYLFGRADRSDDSDAAATTNDTTGDTSGQE